MIGFHVLLVAGSLFAAPAQVAEIQPTCELGAYTRESEFHAAMGRLVVEAMGRAAQSTWDNDPRLAELVSSDAVFRLGAGDVTNWQAGVGVSGAHKIAGAMEADRFRLPSIVGLPRPVDGCGTNEIEIEFIDSRTNRNATIKFEIADGRIQSATGWVGSFTEVPMLPTPSTAKAD